LHLAQCSQASTVLLATAKPRHVHQIARQRSVFQRTHLNCSRVQWWCLVTVVPSCFHFVIIRLTVDCGIFSSKEILWMDLLHRWQPISVSRLNSLSS
ncbi:unnamed protein product, partial [Staurois parvus]